MRNPELYTEGYYHIFSRGVDKRTIFLNRNDYVQFFEQMYLFNDTNYRHSGDPLQKAVLLSGSEVFSMDRDPYVEFFAYCLMPNHYHFFLKQLKDGGISTFLHKLNMGYSRAFNRRENRSGALFEGKFKAVPITKNEHFRFLPVYIHLNAIDLFDKLWREGVLENWSEARRYLDHFPWSSHGMYLGKDELYPVTSPNAVSEIFGNMHEYEQDLEKWAMRFSNLQIFEDIVTE